MTKPEKSGCRGAEIEWKYWNDRFSQRVYKAFEVPPKYLTHKKASGVLRECHHPVEEESK